MIRDLRHALRVFRQSPGWTTVVLVSLALGLGANTAFFSAVNSAMLQTLAVEEPQRLVRLGWAGDNDLARSTSEYGFGGTTAAGERRRTTFSYPLFEALVESADSVDLFAAAPFRRQNVTYSGESEVASTLLVSGRAFELLGLQAHRGRLLATEDDDPSASPAVVLSHGYWQRRFGGSDIVGRPLQVGRVAATIVGVLPAGFGGVQGSGRDPADLHLPVALSARLGGPELTDATYFWLQLLGRLEPEATAEQALGNLQGPFEASVRERLDDYIDGLSEEQAALSSNQGLRDVPHLLVDSGARGVYDPNPNVTRDARILSVVVALVLLLVCANVANLLLARASSRRHELSVRQSFGATRRRLVRQLLVESSLLSLVGGALGLLIAVWARRLLPFASDAELDGPVFLFALLLSLVTGVVFSLVPALRATGSDLAASLQEGSRSVMGSRRLLGRGLLVAQVAMAVVLLVGAFLFLSTLRNLRAVDVGFDPDDLMLVEVDPSLVYEDEERIAQTHRDMVERLRGLPGVESVSLAQSAFLSGSTSSRTLHLPGGEDEDGQGVHTLVVGPGLFDTLGIPRLAGRDFGTQDRADAPLVAIVNESASRQLWEGGALGERFGWSPETRQELEVIGVVGDVKYAEVRDEAPPTIFVPYAQSYLARGMVLELRTAADPVTLTAPVRAALREVDPRVPILNVSTQSEEIAQQLRQERFFAVAYAAFGALALLIAAVGLFGVASYGVAERTQEIGVRMALGARRGDVVRMVVGESMVLVVVGLVLGLVASQVAARVISSLLYGVEVSQPGPLAAAALLLLGICGVAAWLPARRAAGVDPVGALHQS